MQLICSKFPTGSSGKVILTSRKSLSIIGAETIDDHTQIVNKLRI